MDEQAIDPRTLLADLVTEIGRDLANKAAEAVLPVVERVGTLERRIFELETKLRLAVGILSAHHEKLFPQPASAPDRTLN